MTFIIAIITLLFPYSLVPKFKHYVLKSHEVNEKVNKLKLGFAVLFSKIV